MMGTWVFSAQFFHLLCMLEKFTVQYWKKRERLFTLIVLVLENHKKVSWFSKALTLCFGSEPLARCV